MRLLAFKIFQKFLAIKLIYQIIGNEKNMCFSELKFPKTKKMNKFFF